jgi:hypothetical protein
MCVCVCARIYIHRFVEMKSDTYIHAYIHSIGVEKLGKAAANHVGKFVKASVGGTYQ